MNRNVMPDVRPISDLRQSMTEILDSIDNEKRPVILTKHGRGRYIMLNLDDYNAEFGMETLRREVMSGVEAARAGDVSDFRAFAAELKEDLKHGRV